MVNYKDILMTAAIISAMSTSAFAMENEEFRSAPIARQASYLEKEPNFLTNVPDLSSYFLSREKREEEKLSSYTLPLTTYTPWPPHGYTLEDMKDPECINFLRQKALLDYEKKDRSYQLGREFVRDLPGSYEDHDLYYPLNSPLSAYNPILPEKQPSEEELELRLKSFEIRMKDLQLEYKSELAKLTLPEFEIKFQKPELATYTPTDFKLNLENLELATYTPIDFKLNLEGLELKEGQLPEDIQ